jgi:hypothetical protein
MAILIMCTNSQCGELFDVPDDAAGTEVSCPSCGTTQTAPESVPVPQITKPQDEETPSPPEEQGEQGVNLSPLEVSEEQEAPEPPREDLILKAKLASETDIDLSPKQQVPPSAESPYAPPPPSPRESEPPQPALELEEPGAGEMMGQPPLVHEEDAIEDDVAATVTEEGLLESRRAVGGAFVLGLIGIACGLVAGAMTYKSAPITGAYVGAGVGWVVGFVFALMVIFAIDKEDFRKVRCTVCDNIFPAGTDACTFCGSKLLEQSVSPLAAECLRAGSHAMRNKTTIYWMAMLLMIANVLIFGAYHLLNAFGDVLGAGRIGVIAICAIVGLWVFGYWSEFFAKAVADAMYRPLNPASLPAFRILGTFGMGFRGLGMLVVYVVPVFTFPLLPLGMLALGAGRRRNLLDLTGAVAVVWKHTKDFAVLWLVILMWLSAIGLGVSLIAMTVYLVNPLLPDVGGSTAIAFSMLIASGAALMLAVVVSVFGLAIFRSVGMFARYNPRTLKPGGTGPGSTRPLSERST